MKLYLGQPVITFRFPDSRGMEKNVIPQFHESPKNENHHGIGIPTHT